MEKGPALCAAHRVDAFDVAIHEQRVQPDRETQLLGLDLAPRKNAEPVIARQFEQWQLYATTNSSSTRKAITLQAQRAVSTWAPLPLDCCFEAQLFDARAAGMTAAARAGAQQRQLFGQVSAFHRA